MTYDPGGEKHINSEGEYIWIHESLSLKQKWEGWEGWGMSLAIAVAFILF